MVAVVPARPRAHHQPARRGQPVPARRRADRVGLHVVLDGGALRPPGRGRLRRRPGWSRLRLRRRLPGRRARGRRRRSGRGRRGGDGRHWIVGRGLRRHRCGRRRRGGPWIGPRCPGRRPRVAADRDADDKGEYDTGRAGQAAYRDLLGLLQPRPPGRHRHPAKCAGSARREQTFRHSPGSDTGEGTCRWEMNQKTSIHLRYWRSCRISDTLHSPPEAAFKACRPGAPAGDGGTDR